MTIVEADMIVSLSQDFQAATRKHGESSLQAITAKNALFAALDALKSRRSA